MKSVNGYNVWRGLPGLYTVYCGSCQCVVNYVYSSTNRTSTSYM